MRKLTKRSVTIAAVAAVAVGAGGAAWAAWQVQSSASVVARSESMKPLTVTVTDVNDLYPGKTSDIIGTVTNPNRFDVKISSISAPQIRVTAASGNACNSTNTGITVVPPTQAELAALPPVAKGATNAAFTFPQRVQMTNDSNSECQGGAFTLTFTVSGASAA